MTTPGWWEFSLLALAAYRITRLLAWDTFPPVERARARLLGEWCVEPGEGPNGGPVEGPYYQRPLLADLFHCPFCLGFWVSLAVYLSWWALPEPTLAVASVAAISAVVGLVAKKLDE